MYPWVWIPAACAMLLLAAATRPRIGSPGEVRAVDGTLLVAAAAMVLQLAPLPYAVLQLIDSQAFPLRAAIGLVPLAESVEALHLPISILPRDTVAALGVYLFAAVCFWTCRQICETGGTGRIVRAIALTGLVASVAAIVQRAESKELLYGVWRPIDAGARPYGPFVNRNHFVTWVIMAWPLVFGYLLARAPATRPQQISQRLAAALKQLGSIRIWLVAAVCLMTLAVLISTSRSGIIGLMGSLTASAWLSRHRRGAGVRRWTIFQAVLLALVAVSFANFDAIVARFDETLVVSAAGRGRRAIWADARRVVQDFAITGTGAGTFGTAIAVYQTAEPGYSIGHAHNHYLQLAAEGGALVGVPAALAAGAFLALFRRRLKEDHSANHLIRAGAISGIVAALIQSLWETGLRMPANAMLLAVLAAVATHSPAVSIATRHRHG